MKYLKGGGWSSRKFPVFSTKILLSPPPPLSPFPTINNKQTLRIKEKYLFPQENIISCFPNIPWRCCHLFSQILSLSLENLNWANQRNSRWHYRLNRDVLWDVTQSRWTLERDPGEPGSHTRQVKTYNAFQIKNITCIINQTSVIVKASWLRTRGMVCGRGWFALLQLSHGLPP